MKIVAGMGSIDDYIRYASAGADEVFIGYVPERWQEMYGLSTPLNRREVCFYNVQIGSFSELEILADMVREYHTAVTIAFNGLYFTPEQYPVIAEIMEECLLLGFDSVIVADLGLMVYLHQTGLSEKLRIHVSGEFGEINHLIFKELAELGVRRLIFHRKVSIKNMENIISMYKGMYEKMRSNLPPMEFEAFILNENCHFNGAFCNSLHCDELVPMCRMPYRLGTDRVPADFMGTDVINTGQMEGKNTMSAMQPVCSPDPAAQTYGHSETVTEGDFDYDYGLSAIKQLEKIGITHLKIVGRGADTEYMEYCIREVKKMISSPASTGIAPFRS